MFLWSIIGIARKKRVLRYTEPYLTPVLKIYIPSLSNPDHRKIIWNKRTCVFFNGEDYDIVYLDLSIELKGVEACFYKMV